MCQGDTGHKCVQGILDISITRGYWTCVQGILDVSVSRGYWTCVQGILDVSVSRGYWTCVQGVLDVSVNGILDMCTRDTGHKYVKGMDMCKGYWM